MNDDLFSKDPTWREARAIVEKTLYVPPNLVNALHGGWCGLLGMESFVRTLSFANLPTKNLPRVIMEGVVGGLAVPGSVQESIQGLGIETTCAVCAVMHVTATVLRGKPPPLWQGVIREMMVDVEVGARLGNRASGIGIARGIIAGLAERTGYGLLMRYDHQKYRSWFLTSATRDSPEETIKTFGCEPYQVSALALQQIGFGTDSAVGVALSLGDLDPRHLHFNEEQKAWRGAVDWIRALRAGKNFPSHEESRGFFPELKPAKDGKNPVLATLYTEIAKVRTQGSVWTWHLPYPSYEDAIKGLGG